jgi:hypothetical protein
LPSGWTTNLMNHQHISEIIIANLIIALFSLL